MFTSLEIVLMPLAVILLLAWLYQTGKAAQYRLMVERCQKAVDVARDAMRDFETKLNKQGIYLDTTPRCGAEWPEVLEEREK